LPRYIVKTPGIDGLEVTLNGAKVDLSVDVALPIDPGPIAITARAPDHKDWTGTATATEAQTTTIEIPMLVSVPKPPPVKRYIPQRQRQHTGLLIGLAATSGVAIVSGAFLGVRANSKWNAAEEACGGNVASCPGDAFVQASDDYDSAHKAATASSVMFGVGVAALAGTVVVWYLGREHAVTPTVGSDHVGVALSGSW
jgi:hypothetical protein